MLMLLPSSSSAVGATPVPVPAPSLLALERPETMSSMRRSMAADSTAVLMDCTLTA